MAVVKRVVSSLRVPSLAGVEKSAMERSSWRLGRLQSSWPQWAGGVVRLFSAKSLAVAVALWLSQVRPVT